MFFLKAHFEDFTLNSQCSHFDYFACEAMLECFLVYKSVVIMGVGAYRDGGDTSLPVFAASPPRGGRGVLWTKSSKGKMRRRHGVEKPCLVCPRYG